MRLVTLKPEHTKIIDTVANEVFYKAEGVLLDAGIDADEARSLAEERSVRLACGRRRGTRGDTAKGRL